MGNVIENTTEMKDRLSLVLEEADRAVFLAGEFEDRINPKFIDSHEGRQKILTDYANLCKHFDIMHDYVRRTKAMLSALTDLIQETDSSCSDKKAASSGTTEGQILSMLHEVARTGTVSSKQLLFFLQLSGANPTGEK